MRIKYLSVNQVAALYGVTRHTVAKWVATGAVNVVQTPSGARRIPLDVEGDYLKFMPGNGHRRDVAVIPENEELPGNATAPGRPRVVVPEDNPEIHDDFSDRVKRMEKEAKEAEREAAR